MDYKKTPMYASLTASNEKIKAVRAEQIIQLAEGKYSSAIRSAEDKLKALEIDLAMSADFAPTNSQDLTYRKDFDPVKWAEGRIAAVKELEAVKYNLGILKKDYNELFVGDESRDNKE